MSLFQWTKRREQAALLLAEDTLSDEQIAAELGVTRRAMARWKKHPDFRARINSIVQQMRAAILSQGIADQVERVKALNDRWGRMKRVVSERADDPELEAIPGGKTGLIVHNVKGIGKGEDFQLIDLYEVDTGLLKEMREHEKQAAQEVGQWAEKVKHSLDLSNLSDEELSLLEHLVGKTAHAGRDTG